MENFIENVIFNETIESNNEIKEIEVKKGDATMENYKLSKPFEYEGKTYTEFNFDFNKLNGNDILSATKEAQETGENIVIVEVSKTFQAILASKAAGVGSDIIRALPIKDFNQITNLARSFLL